MYRRNTPTAQQIKAQNKLSKGRPMPPNARPEDMPPTQLPETSDESEPEKRAKRPAEGKSKARVTNGPKSRGKPKQRRKSAGP